MSYLGPPTLRPSNCGPLTLTSYRLPLTSWLLAPRSYILLPLVDPRFRRKLQLARPVLSAARDQAARARRWAICQTSFGGRFLPKRTYQPKKRRRLRRHGFMARNSTRGGRAVLKRRMLKGRWRLAV